MTDDSKKCMQCLALSAEPEDFLTGIIAGLPVTILPVEGDGMLIGYSFWAGLILTPYMNSWFYNDDSPVFVYEGSYWEGLFQFLFMKKEEEEP
jgi:hypothetical protein